MIDPKLWPAANREIWDVARIKPYAKNARTHSEADVAAARRAIDEYGWTYPLLVTPEGELIAGHRRFAASQLEPPMEEVPVLIAKGWTLAQIKAYRLWDNKSTLSGGWDDGLLRTELAELQTGGFDLSLAGFDLAELNVFRGNAPAAPENPAEPKKIGNLADKFWAVPFSVLNAREGWWQDRKRAWLALGIESEVGRGANLLKMSDTVLEPDPAKRAAKKAKNPPGLAFSKTIRHEGEADEVSAAIAETGGAGTSIFDPVLCELAYRWFCPPKGLVLDPFAGGSVRGIVASKLGRRYLGVDLRNEQIIANRAQAKKICQSSQAPKWIEGDSIALPELVPAKTTADLLFSCPPYGDLERYSDDERDLSTMAYKDFLKAYQKIIAASCSLLAKDRFAVFVVGDIRDQDDRGVYRGFHMATIAAFEKAGLQLYNHAILITAAGTLAMRSGRAFESSRKLGKTHQDVLVFVKGDPVKATAAIGAVEFGEPEGMESTRLEPGGKPGPFGEKVTAEQIEG